jgi:type I restriction enzyme S subunit
MEVKPGYKQTEIGVIPEDWEVKPLKQISPRQSVGLVINPSTHFDKAGTVPLLVGSNVSENSIDSTTANRITQASNDLLAASRLAAGDLVMVRVGEPGVTAVVPPELDGCNCASMMIVRRDRTFDSHWLCCAMNSQHGREQVGHVQYGTAQKQFNISDAVDFRYAVPPIAEQRAIAAALRDVDALLKGLTRLIAKKCDLKRAAMRQLLTGQTRLPGFHGKWRTTALKSFATGDRFAIVDGPFGSQLKVEEYVASGVPVVEMEHLNDTYIPERIERCITPRKFEKVRRSAVYPGDIVISKTGTLGKLGIIPPAVERGLITSRLAKITLNSARANRLFVFQALRNLRRQGYWEEVSQGGTMQILGIRMLQDAPIPDLCLSEQTAIAAPQLPTGQARRCLTSRGRFGSRPSYSTSTLIPSLSAASRLRATFA